MRIPFTKYQGTGNDFIIIDDRKNVLQLNESQIQHLCHRKWGIGSDGLILIQTSKDLNVHFHMQFHNPDGSVSFCGNGSRCAIHFAYSLGIFDKNCLFSASDGLHQGIINKETITVSIGEVSTIHNKEGNSFLNTGSPHLIVFEKVTDHEEIVNRGRYFRYHKDYQPSGTNVNFVYEEHSKLNLCTYERGVEDETLSCGTGTVAAAIAASIRFQRKPPLVMHTKGGALIVYFTENDAGNFQNIFLEGPVQKTFDGIIDIN